MSDEKDEHRWVLRNGRAVTAASLKAPPTAAEIEIAALRDELARVRELADAAERRRDAAEYELMKYVPARSTHPYQCMQCRRFAVSTAPQVCPDDPTEGSACVWMERT